MSEQQSILIVDDDRDNLGLIAEVLAAKGYLVRAVDRGDLALASASATVPDLVLLDVRMPGMSGLEVFRRLRADAATSGVPVVFLTAAPDSGARLDALELGAADFITKPVDSAELLARIRNQLEFGRMRSRLERQARELTAANHKLSALWSVEEQFRQAQKMESVGRLAGGVAHDFNNLLTAINGYASCLRDTLEPGDPRREDVAEILSAGERAATLTRQLLAFSRKQILDLRIVDLNEAVGGTARMLKRLIGEDITLDTRLCPSPCPVRIDVGQLEQALMNLAVNSRDAMPQGGALTVATEVAVPDEAFRRAHPSFQPAAMARLTVSDTGCGMSEEVRKQVFEPFFTTKERGKGTGLGLAMVYGLIKQSGGEVGIESAPGRGTTVTIFLPMADAAKPAGEAQPAPGSRTAKGTETVLVVEDEDIVRRLAKRTLADAGYTVLDAPNGAEALLALERLGAPVALLVTDVVMPGMNGRALARQAAAKRLAGRTLFMSGYTDNAIVENGVLEKGLAFIYKPFSPEDFLRKVREVLDGPADQAHS